TLLLIAQKKDASIQLQAEEFDLMAAAGDLDEIEEYAELLEPIPEPYQVQQNANNVISAVSSMEQSGRTVDQNLATSEETRALYDSLYNNLAIEVENVNMVNRKMRETNAELTTKLARYKNQEKCFEINQEKYDKLERCYQKFVYQEQCLTKKINVLHLSSAKTITTLNEEIANFSNQLSKEKSTVSSIQEEKKKLNFDFKIREDELLDKQIQLENKIKELDNILVKTGQSIQTMHMLSPKPDSFYHTEQKMALEKHDPPVVYDSEETLQLAQESRLKMKQLNKEIKPANYAKINQLSGVFVSQKAKSREELYFSNISKMASVSKSISIPNEEFSNDTTLSVARKLLNEPKFVRDFKSLAKEADESLAKHKTLEFEIERLSRAVLRAQLFDKVSEQKDTTKGTSANTKFANQSTSGTKLYSVTPFPNSIRSFPGCSKNMTGNMKLLINFVWKFLGTVHFGNDHVAIILEVAFRRKTWFVRNLEGVDLLKGNYTTNLYTINLHEMASASPIFLMARATSTISWLWHQRLSHLNFDTINDLAKNNLVTGLLKFKYYKEHLCSSYEKGKSKKASHPPTPVPNSKQRSKDEAPEEIKIFLKKISSSASSSHHYIGKLGAKGDIGFFIGYVNTNNA
ncbi:retrovirus-related pol polyprotein from transposon TNT 1-94, partial [Tanacetum coccineum]